MVAKWVLMIVTLLTQLFLGHVSPSVTQYSGVIDRFEGHKAVVLCEDNESEYILKKESLPAEAEEGDWLILSYEMDTLVDVEVDDDKTMEMKRIIQEKLKGLTSSFGTSHNK